MPESVDGNTGREVEVLPLLGVVDDAALSVREDDGRSGVGRQKALGLLLEERGDVRRSGVVRVGGLEERLVGLARCRRTVQNVSVNVERVSCEEVVEEAGACGLKRAERLKRTSSDANRAERATGASRGIARAKEVADLSILGGEEGGGGCRRWLDA